MKQRLLVRLYEIAVCDFQVEFEARSPQECDFYGLVHLLKQMLRPSSNINVSDLADRIISQRAVGSVITQSPDDADDTDDEDDNIDENAGVVANGGNAAGGGGANGTPNNEVSHMSNRRCCHFSKKKMRATPLRI